MIEDHVHLKMCFHSFVGGIGDFATEKRINPHTVVKKLQPNPVLRGQHGPQGLFQVKRYFTFQLKSNVRVWGLKRPRKTSNVSIF